MYIDIFKNNLYQNKEKMDLKDNFIFMQDNDPKYLLLIHKCGSYIMFGNISAVIRYKHY